MFALFNLTKLVLAVFVVVGVISLVVTLVRPDRPELNTQQELIKTILKK